MKLYEHIVPADHIRFEAFSHPAYEKGDLVAVGGITGIVDLNVEAGAPLTLDAGSPYAVFRTELAEPAVLGGTPAVGANLYLTNGALTLTAGSDPVFGVITDIAGAVSFVKIGV